MVFIITYERNSHYMTTRSHVQGQRSRSNHSFLPNFVKIFYSKLLFFSLIDPETYLTTYMGYILLDYDKDVLYNQNATCSRSKVKVKIVNFVQFYPILYSKLDRFLLIHTGTCLTTFNDHDHHARKEYITYHKNLRCWRLKVKVKLVNFAELCQILQIKLASFLLIDTEISLTASSCYI